MYHIDHWSLHVKEKALRNEPNLKILTCQLSFSCYIIYFMSVSQISANRHRLNTISSQDFEYIIRSLKSMQIIIFRIFIFLNNVVYDTPYKCLPVVPTGGINCLESSKEVLTLYLTYLNTFFKIYTSCKGNHADTLIYSSLPNQLFVRIH